MRPSAENNRAAGFCCRADAGVWMQRLQGRALLETLDVLRESGQVDAQRFIPPVTH